ncbi:hypothetical protein EIN_498590 [Entamoeba invadens IP1]|uniref:Uncharacterized protein n=1 Tax=Entamoeba invadens IP1 TaxID=370355 RepID=A0A0A1UDX6_ENTIV|nr:hypothetical protein EIN_498590 [Entamoeba invadens IP1]ELP94649.1 hypothetical protein EIN_498590 [Entamoeba invadens IP1]|eukprot:XP_004261420.1 hypothetical protein EIN_498590 [Entamoeba invadens IP1]
MSTTLFDGKIQDLLHSEERYKDKVCVTPLEKRIPILQASRTLRNFQTLQQCLCICLLSEMADITIKQPAKKSVVTQQYMRIKSIDFGDGEVLVLTEFLKRRCVEQKNDDIARGVPCKTATRRLQNNKKIELLHLLIDLLVVRCGYEFESKYTEGKIGTNKQESIKKVIRDDKVIIEGEKLLDAAEQINQIITRRLQVTHKELVIKRGDPMLSLIYQ